MAFTACGQPSPPADAATSPTTDEGTLVLVRIDVSPDVSEPGSVGPDTEGPSLPPCASGCPEDSPTPPPCHRLVLDVKSCTCAVVLDDGAACDDGDPCTVGETCSEGACQPGLPELEAEPLGGWVPDGTPLAQPGEPGFLTGPQIHVEEGCRTCDGRLAYFEEVRGPLSRYAAVHEFPDGGIAVLSRSPTDPELIRYDEKLTPVWAVPLSIPSKYLWLEDLALMADGALLAAGRFVAPNAQEGGWLGAYDAGGDELWTQDLQLGRVRAVLATPTGLVAHVTGNAEDGDGNVPVDLAFFDQTGELQATKYLGQSRTNGKLAGRFLAGADGSTTLATTRYVDEVARQEAVLWRCGLDGVVSEAALHEGPDRSFATMVVEVGAHTYLMPGAVYYAGLTYSDFAVVWRAADDEPPLEALALGSWPPDIDGGAFAVGDSRGDGRAVFYAELISGFPTELEQYNDDEWHHVMLAAVDPWGNLLWSRRYGRLIGAAFFESDGVPENTVYDAFYDVHARPDGGVTAVGFTGAAFAAQQRVWVVRTDAWGRTCGMRLGVCAGLTLQDCDDDNPCTVDWCDPDAGCTFPPLPDGSPCGDPLSCKAGVCG